MNTTFRLNTKLITNMGNVLHFSVQELMTLTTIANTTWYRIMEKPANITIQQLLCFSNGLHIPVRRFFLKDKEDFIGKRDDYVSEPYLTCHYDDGVLRELVNSSSSATWKQASQQTGISRSNLRNSLLAVTRTPVTRFLTVCDVFKIDPFSVLVDPNVDRKKQKRTNNVPDVFSTEIKTLRRQVDELSKVVDDLTKKYEELLAAHNRLERTVNVNINSINGSYIGIAAEP